MMAAQRAATDTLSKMSKKEQKLYMRAQHFTTQDPPPGVTPLDDWGRQVAENMRSVIGEGKNAKILNHVANGTTPSLAELKAIDEKNWPTAVKGRVYVPAAHRGTMENIANLTFRRLINPYVNFMSRQPIALNEMVREWTQLRPLVTSGQMDFDEATNLAMTRSTYRTLRFVHNLHDRSQLSETLRNWVPFYFAQEQAYKRMGRLLATDPGAFRRYQMMISGVGAMTAKARDQNGQGYFTFPGGSWLARGTTELGAALGLPINNVDAGNFATSLSSANVIFPLSEGFRPDISPVAAIPAKALNALFPELGPGLSNLVGAPALTQSWWQLAVPNTTMQRAIRTAAGTITNGEGDRAFASSMMQAMQFALYDQQKSTERWIANGRKGPQPEIVPPPGSSYIVRQNFVNRIKNQTMILFATNTVLGFFSPTSTSASVKDFGFPAELSKDIDKSGSVSKGITEFLARHPDATPWTTFQSISPIPSTVDMQKGVSIPSNDAGEQWIHDNRAFIDANPTAAFYMMPKETGKYDSAVYNEQLAQGDRVKRSPQQFLDALYVNAGNQVYYPALTKFEAQVNAPGANKTQLYPEWTAYLNQLKKANPTWAEYGPLNTTNRDQTIIDGLGDLRKMAATGNYPHNDVSDAMIAVLSNFEQANAQWWSASQSTNYAHEQKVVKDSWQTYVLGLGKQYPQLKSGLDTLFLDSLGVVNQNG
jgi:hypothetical protein